MPTFLPLDSLSLPAGLFLLRVITVRFRFSAAMTRIPSAWSKCIILLSRVSVSQQHPNTNLESASDGKRDRSAARSLGEQVSGFTSVQGPTAIVKVEAGIGMVT